MLRLCAHNCEQRRHLIRAREENITTTGTIYYPPTGAKRPRPKLAFPLADTYITSVVHLSPDTVSLAERQRGVALRIVAELYALEKFRSLGSSDLCSPWLGFDTDILRSRLRYPRRPRTRVR